MGSVGVELHPVPKYPNNRRNALLRQTLLSNRPILQNPLPEIHKDRPEKRRALKTTGSEFKEFTLDIVAEQTKLKYVYADTSGKEPSHTKRAHDRRGHWRTLKSGKKIWVRACRVGNIDLGLIKKDYIINNDSL